MTKTDLYYLINLETMTNKENNDYMGRNKIVTTLSKYLFSQIKRSIGTVTFANKSWIASGGWFLEEPRQVQISLS